MLAMISACGGGTDVPVAPVTPKVPVVPETPTPPAAVASVVVTAPSSSIAIGQSLQASAQARDAAGITLTNRTVSWRSADAAVATVSTTGVIAAVATGTTVVTATSEGQSGDLTINIVAADLAAIIDTVRRAQGLPALGGVIVTRRGVYALGAAGVRRSTGIEAVTAQDVWPIGSDTKAFTAMTIGRAIDAGKLSWDATLPTLLPDLASTMRAEFRSVTLAQVMSHAGGFVNNNTTGLPNIADARAARDAWNQWTVQQAPVGPRGSYYYSNNGYGLLGGVLDRAYGEHYESVVQSQLYQPLGITDATWGAAPGANPPNSPIGHTWSGTAWVPCEGCSNRPGASASGRVHITLASWARVIQELMRADAGQSTLLSQATARRLTTPAVPFGGADAGWYAMGWTTPAAAGVGQRVAQHDGSNTYMYARAVMFLDTGVAFLMVTNATEETRGPSAMNALYARLNVFWATGR